MRRIAAALTVPLFGILLLAGCGSSGTPSSSSSSGGSGTNSPVTVTGAFGASPNVTIPASKASSSLAIKTVIKGTGPTLADSFIRVIPSDGSSKVKIAYSDVAAMAFTGRDTAAGKSFEAWVKKYWEKKAAGEKNIQIEPEKLD